MKYASPDSRLRKRLASQGKVPEKKISMTWCTPWCILVHTRYCNNELITCGGRSCPGTLLISPDDPPTSSALVRPVPAVPQTALIRILTRQRRTRRRGCGRRGRRAQPGVVDRVSSEELVVVVKLLVPRSPTVVVSKLKRIKSFDAGCPTIKIKSAKKAVDAMERQKLYYKCRECFESNRGETVCAKCKSRSRVPSLNLS